MRNALATLLTLLVLGGLLWLGARNSETTSPGTPKEQVWAMLDAAESGDVERYLDSFSGELRERLRTSADEMGEESFSSWLRSSFAALRGIALVDTEGGQADSPRESARIVVEYVYAETEEEQELTLSRNRKGSWRIASASQGERRESLIPYGTPIERWE